MQKRSFKFLLYISLAFNIAFIGGFVYRYLNAPFHQPGLPPEEMKPPVKDFFFQKRDEIKQFGKDFMDSKKQFLESLTLAEFNEDKSTELMQESVEKQILMETEIGKSMIEIRKKMSAEEAEKAFGRMIMREKRFEKPPVRRRNKF